MSTGFLTTGRLVRTRGTVGTPIVERCGNHLSLQAFIAARQLIGDAMERAGSPDKTGEQKSDCEPKPNTAVAAEAAEPCPPIPISDDEKRRRLLYRFLGASGGFWRGPTAMVSWTLTLSLFGVIVLLIGAAYAMNVWNRALFDGLQARDGEAVGKLAIVYLVILLVSVGLSVVQVYLRAALQRGWRAWVTNRLVDHWLTNGRYFQLSLVKGDHANPEARIAEDVRIATEAPVDFVSGVLQALLSAITFIVVLWTIGGALDLSFVGIPIEVPGFLVVAAVFYAVVASTAMALIGRQYVAVSEAKNQAEAEYRYAVTRVRENGESIALIRGEEEERNALARSLGTALAVWRQVSFQMMKTTSVSQTSSYIAPVLPILLCAPKFLDGSMSLGQIMQAASAFTIVQAAFNWLVDNYPRLADWTASARRVAALTTSLDALEAAESSDRVGRITISNDEPDAALRLRDLSVSLADGTAILDETEVDIAPGERLLIAGASGSGKSTLVRAIAGLWPWGNGTVQIRKGALLFLLPQRPYVPLGTLLRAATYPEAEDAYNKEVVAAAFRDVGLPQLVDRLDDVAPWDQILSGGEKQRLAFARIVLHRPDIVVLDEATAALDAESQNKLMEMLVTRFPETTVVSVGHRPELEAYHTRKVTLARRDEGARIVSDDALRGRTLGRAVGRIIRKIGGVSLKPERAAGSG